MKSGTRATAAVVALSLVASGPAGVGLICTSPALASPRDFIAPVEGSIVRRFEQPLGPYAAGHRGIDFGVPAGTAVVASASGTVAFAGPVADDGLFVSIRHDEVLETTYSFLSEVFVSQGQDVRQGDLIGSSGDGHPGEESPALHFGARIAKQYIDPEILLFGKLDDISELISLAPLDEGEEHVGIWSGGSPYLQPVGPPEAKPIPSKGLFVSIGRKIALGAGAVARAPGRAMAWGAAKLKASVGMAGKILRASGEALGAAYNRTKAFALKVGREISGLVGKSGELIGALWAKGKRATVATALFLDRVGRAIGRAAAAVGRFLVKGVRLMGRAMSSIAKTAGKSLVVVKKLGRTALKRVLLVKHLGMFAYGMAKGTVQQIGCSRKGGAPPPKLPSKEDLARGVKPPPPPNDNIVVAVAGIGSSTKETGSTITANATIYQMDFRTLGYSEDQVYYFSYKGLDDRGGGGPYGLHAPYSKEDTYKEIERAAEELAKQINEIRLRHPDKKVDLVAHSQGGLVAQYYVARIYDRGRDSNIELDHLITIASPHGGADAAAVHDRLSDNDTGTQVIRALDWVSSHVGIPPPSASSARQMAEDSEFISKLSEAWDPSKVKTTTVAATWDVVVTASHTRLRGAANYTADMPGGSLILLGHHGDVVAANSTREIVYNALADTPSQCTALRNAIADYGTGRLISEIEGTLIDGLDLLTEGATLGRKSR